MRVGRRSAGDEMGACESGRRRAIVLGEGICDQIAVESLVTGNGPNLDGEGISVVPIGGAQAIGRLPDSVRLLAVGREVGRSV